MNGSPIFTTSINEDGKTVYKYELKATGRSSADLGACEVCGLQAVAVYMMTPSRLFERTLRKDGELDQFGWARDREHCTVFGHRDCVLGQRKGVEIFTAQSGTKGGKFYLKIADVAIAIQTTATGYQVVIGSTRGGPFDRLSKAYAFAQDKCDLPF